VQVDVNGEDCKAVPGTLFVAPEALIGPAGFTPVFGSRTIFDALRQDMAGGKETIVFVHGFSNTFVNAVERAARIVDFYGGTRNIFAFSWPSVGSLLPIPLPYADYAHDRKTAQISGPAIARTLKILYDYIDGLAAAQHCRGKLHLLCHSMGNFALRWALQALLRLPPADTTGSALLTGMPSGDPDPAVLRRTFDQIILAAADEDEDAFDDAAKLKYLPRLGSAVTVYSNKRDWILSKLSAVTKFNGPRLGSFGPDNMGPISDKVSSVDVSDVENFGEDPESHQYYRILPRVRDDIVEVLADKPPNLIHGRAAVREGRWRLLP
jgi:esterase/lipase superfamily enzyme